MPPLYEFHFRHGPYPDSIPSAESPITNPLSLLLCRYPLGSYLSSQNFALIHSRPFPHSEPIDPLYLYLTAGTYAHIARPTKAGAQTFWLKNYSENAGILEILEEHEIVKRTGETYKQGFVDLVAVETCLVPGQWAEVCGNLGCGRREQVGDEARMKKCMRCKEVFYCGVECQKGDWMAHKERCGTLKEAAADRAAVV